MEGGDSQVAFRCRTWHAAAARRLFLEVAKQDPTAPAVPRPLEAPDTRSEQTIRLEPLGGGSYRGAANGATDTEPCVCDRCSARKACGADRLGRPQVVFLACGHEHDALTIMLLRAQNLRAALREEGQNASRGVLVAPSAQE